MRRTISLVRGIFLCLLSLFLLFTSLRTVSAEGGNPHVQTDSLIRSKTNGKAPVLDSGPPAEAVDFDQGFYAFEVGTFYDLTDHLHFTPYEAKFAGYTVTSSDTSVLNPVKFDKIQYVDALKTGLVQLTLTAANGKSKTINAQVVDRYACGVSVNSPLDITLAKGQTSYLNAYLRKADGASAPRDSVKFEITKGKNLVSVSENGQVEGLNYGIAEVRAYSYLDSTEYNQEGHMFEVRFTVRVAQPPSSLSFEQSSYTFKQYQFGQFYTKTDKAEAEYSRRTYTSDNSNVILVNDDGSYSAVGQGKANVTCTAENGVKKTVAVTVTGGSPAGTDYYYAGNPLLLHELEGRNIMLNLYRYNGGNADDPGKFRMQISDPSVAVVENGILTAKGKGVAHLMITNAETGYLYVIEPVVVTGYEKGLSFKKSEINLCEGDDLNLRSLIAEDPEDPFNNAIQFTSYDSSVASVIGYGGDWYLFANRAGSTTIYAESDDYRNASFKVNVGVRQTATSLNLSKSSVNLNVNYSYRPDFVSLGPVFADQSRYCMTSSDPSVAKVIYRPFNEYGQEIVGVSPGTAIITVRSEEEPTLLNKQFTVTVKSSDSSHYRYGHSLVTLGDSARDYQAIESSEGSYTAYVGSDYLLAVNALWNRTDGTEYPEYRDLAQLDYTASNGCIGELSIDSGLPKEHRGFEQYYGSLSFHAVRPGKVTVRTIGNHTVDINIVEKQPQTDPTSITLDASAKVVSGKKIKLTPVIKPDSAVRTVTWTSLNPNVAKVDADGTVTGLAAGRTKVQAETINGKKAECEVTVLFKDAADSSKYFYEPVYWAFFHDPQITTGTDSDKFSPNNNVTRGQLVTFLYRAAGEPSVGSISIPFTDVKSSAFYYNAVKWAYDSGITTGTSDTTFSPNENVTRGQMVAFLWRYKGSPEPSKPASFADVKPGAFYAKAVAWAAETGVTTGTSATTFSPKEVCSRAQAVTFLYRAVH